MDTQSHFYPWDEALLVEMFSPIKQAVCEYTSDVIILINELHDGWTFEAT